MRLGHVLLAALGSPAENAQWGVLRGVTVLALHVQRGTFLFGCLLAPTFEKGSFESVIDSRITLANYAGSIWFERSPRRIIFSQLIDGWIIFANVRCFFARSDSID